MKLLAKLYKGEIFSRFGADVPAVKSQALTCLAQKHTLAFLDRLRVRQGKFDAYRLTFGAKMIFQLSTCINTHNFMVHIFLG